MERLYIRCDCHSINHMGRFSYDPDNKDFLYFEILMQDKSFWKRLKNAIKHIFGFDGVVSELVLSDNSVAKIEDFMMEYRNAK